MKYRRLFQSIPAVCAKDRTVRDDPRRPPHAVVRAHAPVGSRFRRGRVCLLYIGFSLTVNDVFSFPDSPTVLSSRAQGKRVAWFSDGFGNRRPESHPGRCFRGPRGRGSFRKRISRVVRINTGFLMGSLKPGKERPAANRRPCSSDAIIRYSALSFAERFFTNSFSTSFALLLMTLSPNMASLPTMLTSIL